MSTSTSCPWLCPAVVYVKGRVIHEVIRKEERHFEDAAAEAEYAVMSNMARRNLSPWQWGMGFEKLCEIRGVALGQGSSATKRHSQSATVADLAAEVGVSERTARHRLRQWRDLKDEEKVTPETRELVNQGVVPSVKEARQLDELPEDEREVVVEKVKEGATVGKAKKEACGAWASRSSARSEVCLWAARADVRRRTETRQLLPGYVKGWASPSAVNRHLGHGRFRSSAKVKKDVLDAPNIVGGGRPAEWTSRCRAIVTGLLEALQGAPCATMRDACEVWRGGEFGRIAGATPD